MPYKFGRLLSGHARASVTPTRVHTRLRAYRLPPDAMLTSPHTPFFTAIRRITHPEISGLLCRILRMPRIDGMPAGHALPAVVHTTVTVFADILGGCHISGFRYIRTPMPHPADAIMLCACLPGMPSLRSGIPGYELTGFLRMSYFGIPLYPDTYAASCGCHPLTGCLPGMPALRLHLRAYIPRLRCWQTSLADVIFRVSVISGHLCHILAGCHIRISSRHHGYFTWVSSPVWESIMKPLTFTSVAMRGWWLMRSMVS